MYKIAGKTGTAKKVKNGRYVREYYTSFAGYFPAEEPRYSCIVVIDNPKGYQIYGSDVSAPVFKEIADKIREFNYPEKACQYLLFTLLEDSQYIDLHALRQMMHDIWNELD